MDQTSPFHFALPNKFPALDLLLTPTTKTAYNATF